MALVLSNCLIKFYICTKFCRSIPQGFRVTDLNSTVDARVVKNDDGRTENRIPISHHAGATTRHVY